MLFGSPRNKILLMIKAIYITPPMLTEKKFQSLFLANRIKSSFH